MRLMKLIFFSFFLLAIVPSANALLPLFIFQISDQLTAEERKDDSVFGDGSIPTSWSDAGIYDSNAFKLSFKKFQRFVKFNKRDEIANLIQFPIRRIKNKKNFFKKYDKIFTDEFKNRIADQKLNQLWRNFQGVMIAGGRLWFGQDQATHEIQIIDIYY